MAFRLRAPAKVNLTLAVGPRGDDGYHSLRSIFVRIGLADELAVEPLERSDATTGEGDRLVVGGPTDCPVEGNLVLRAFELVRRDVGQRLPPLAAQLDKHVPMGAGLGGGSSDGAAALELALAAWGVGLPPTRFAELALELGSDVPFFASGAPAALVEGRGERVGALPPVGGGAGVLLATFAEPLSTAAVYAAFDDLGVETVMAGAATDELADALRAGIDGERLAARAGELRDANTLWPAAVALAPQLGAVRDELESVAGVPWLLSGSGRSLFSLHRSQPVAEELGRRLAQNPLDGLSGAVFYATDLDGEATTWRSR